MSFGKRKMHSVADELAPTTLICDHRGNEWMVLAQAGQVAEFHFGCETATSSSRFSSITLAGISDHYRAWAKALQKRYHRTLEKSDEPTV